MLYFISRNIHKNSQTKLYICVAFSQYQKYLCKIFVDLSILKTPEAPENCNNIEKNTRYMYRIYVIIRTIHFFETADKYLLLKRNMRSKLLKLSI